MVLPTGTVTRKRIDYDEETPTTTMADYRPFEGVVVGKRDAGIDESIPKDRDWSRMAFHYISDLNDLYEGGDALFSKTPKDIMLARHTRGYRTYFDTSLGGDYAINTPYQYTRTADIEMERLYQDFGSGMGRYYYESIRENAHDIHLRFGVQKFNSGLSFFSNWFDYYNFSLATHGRAPSFLYDIGRVSGIAMGFVAPQVFLIGVLAKIVGLLGGGKFWYVSPTMPLYWSAVTQIFNEITGAMGMTLPPAPIDAIDMKSTDGQGKHTFGNTERSYIGELAAMMPGIYSAAAGSTEEGFTIDIRRIAGRAQALDNQLNATLQKRFSEMSSTPTSETLLEEFDKAFSEVTSGGKQYGQKVEYNASISNKSSVRAYLQEYLNTRAGKGDGDQATVGQKLAEKNKKDGQETNEDDSIQGIYTNGLNDDITNLSHTQGGDNDIIDLFTKELKDGSAWLTLRVDGTGSVSESFSNSTEESAIASTINSWANQRRQLSFNMMGGAILGDVVQGIMNGVKDFAAGGLDGLGLSGVAGFLFGAKVDIPKTYASSSASMSSKTYTLKLRTPYRIPWCVAQDLYLPLSCLLAGTIPLSAGRSSYGQPFYCELYDRGRQVIKNGIISSLSIERGVSGVEWSRDGLPAGIDITFTVENLDTAIHMPLTTTSMFDLIDPRRIAEKVLIGNEGAFADYVSLLSGLSLPDFVYRTNNIRRNWYSFVRQWDSYWDMDHFIQRAAQSSPAKVAQWFVKGTQRR